MIREGLEVVGTRALGLGLGKLGVRSCVYGLKEACFLV